MTAVLACGQPDCGFELVNQPLIPLILQPLQPQIYVQENFPDEAAPLS